MARLRDHPWLPAFLLGTLALLIAHARVYRFLTDDAFISFRYARNLSHGLGLVFNPGPERVEGYTNFLWVLLLAGLDRVGLRPESAAPLLSLAATVALWALVAREALRRPASAAAPWLVLIPALALAVTRSVAVWSSSGLETRLFELLIVAAAFRWKSEVERQDEGTPTVPFAALLMGLAVWTRPDGMLMGLAAIGGALLWLARRGHFDARRFTLMILPFLVLVAAQLMFRLAYYHEWLPNTYYAKIGGRLWWSAGLRYVGAFALEYALWLWLPLVVLGARRRVREGHGLEPLIACSILLPHALYVIAIGGDHFEYRPLDVYFPFLFLLLFDGARALARSPRSRLVAALWVALTLLGLWELPWQSHRQSPGRYLAGFPGASADTPEAARFLDPDRDPLYRLPGLHAIAAAHRSLLVAATARFAGVRAEEHRRFFGIESANARRLAELIREGRLPRDTYVAMPCVGVIPYVTDLPTLDRLGLTDAHVAHGPFARREFVAHDKVATMDYARTHGVELWTDPRPIVHLTDEALRRAMRQTRDGEETWYAADLGAGDYLLARLPLGPERVARRMPALPFARLDDSTFVEPYVRRAIPALRAALAADPADDAARRELASLLVFRGEIAPARAVYRELSARRPGDVQVWLRLWWCSDRLGEHAAGLEALERALGAARAAGDSATVRGIQARLANDRGGRTSATP